MTKSASQFAPGARAYSYLRFSTPEQMGGDSLRRQTSLAAEYAARHCLILDDKLTYQDLGVSAFRSGNLNIGRLGEFKEAVRVGEVPSGSVLLVESLDRISRDYAFDAQQILNAMIGDGIVIVTLLDERVYSLEGLRADPMGMMYAIMGFMRANEESAVKSRRLKQAWQNKRATAGSRPMTSRAPAWLTYDADSGFALIPDRAALVQRIFALTLDGVGQHKIAETFNREGLPTWGRSAHWHRSYIAKILANPATIGTFTPHFMEHVDGKKHRRPTDAVEGYFPEAVDADAFAAVQAVLASPGKPRGRQAAVPVSNILAGIATCPKCGSTMTRVQKGKRSLPSLVCTKAKAGAGCEYKSVRYEHIEDRLRQVLPTAAAALSGLEAEEDLEELVSQAEHLIASLRDDIEALVDSLLESRSPALRARLADKELQLEDAQGDLKALLGRRGETSGKVIGARVAELVAALAPEEVDDIDRAQVNKAIRRLFARAVINWPEGRIDLEWIAGGVCEVFYWTAPDDA